MHQNAGDHGDQSHEIDDQGDHEDQIAHGRRAYRSGRAFEPDGLPRRHHDLIIGDHLGKPTSWLLSFQYRGGQLSGYTCELGRCFAGLNRGLSQTITRAGATLTDSHGRVIGHGVGVHQTALYDMLLTMALLLVLVYLNRKDRRTGILFFTYVLWYGSGRILTDFLRVENRFFGLTGSQWTSTAAVILAVFMLSRYALQSRRPEPERLRTSTST